MTTPGALPARPSLVDVPPVDPAQMTPEEQEQWTVAQVAAITLAAAEARQSITDNVVLQLIPLLRLINPYSEAATERFAAEAAKLVSAGIDQIGRTAWAAVSSRLSVQGFSLLAPYRRPTDGRVTDLAVAYKRVAGDYRRRVAAGSESIKGTVQQAEEERFQAIGGAVVAEGRRGESNAKVQGTERAPGKSGGSTSSSGTSPDGKKSSASGGTDGASGGAADRPKASDRRVNETEDDRAAPDPVPGQEAGGGAADDDPARAEEELRRQAALSDSEKQTLLEQVAQQEMEVRLERMVNDDMALANRAAFRDAVNAAPEGVIKGYRRVLHPELATSGQSCGLCIAASTRIYKKKDLLPLHNLCHCEPVEIVAGRDVGQQINDEDLDTLYGAAGDSTHRTDLSNTKWKVEEHGELGPRLVHVKKNGKRSGLDIGFSSREAPSDRGGQS